MSDAMFDLELDKNLNAAIVAKCPKCHSKHRIRLKDTTSNKEFSFACGFTMSFSGDSLQEMQRSLNKLHRTMKKLGK